MRNVTELNTGILRAALLIFLLTAVTQAWGHATGENYVWVNVHQDHLEGRFEIRLDDLRSKLGLEISNDAEVAGQQIVATAATVEDYIRQHFAISSRGETVPLTFTEAALFEARKLGHFAQYYYRTPAFDVSDQLTVRNTLLFDDDRFHRSLLLVERNEKNGRDYGPEFTALVFSPANDAQELVFDDIRGLLSIRQFVWQGMLHIWIGIDHVLFLVALLLPAVLVRRNGSWAPVESLGSALWNVLKVVTVFTVAHSITLALGALEIIQLPSRLVESVIALSIILVALNNIYPKFQHGTLIIIFVFGLFHGLGFASVMGQLPFRMQDLIWVVLAFNVGVEIGQIAIVAVIVPVIYWMRTQAVYQKAVPVYGSASLILIASYWLIERALGLGA